MALSKLPTALGTAELLVVHVMCTHGIPPHNVSHRGPQFVSRVWKAFCKVMGASASLSSGYHPQTDGQTERTIQDLEAALCCMAEANPATWSSHRLWVEYVHNSLISSATGISPFDASLGYQPPLFPIQEVTLAVPAVQDHIQRCRKVWPDACFALERTQEATQRSANRSRNPAPLYQPGQSVWLSTKDIPLLTDSRKLSTQASCCQSSVPFYLGGSRQQ